MARLFVPTLFSLWLLGSVVHAQSVPIIPVPATPVPEEEDDDELSSDPGDAGSSDEEAEDDEEGVPVDDGIELPPRPWEPPEFRLRAGAGIALPTAGDNRPLARITQDVELQLRDAAPFYFGIGGAEVFSTFVIGTVGVNAGLAAWVLQDPGIRLQGAIHVHLGASFGGGYVSPDIAGEVDFRLLTADDYLELHLRGGFFTLNSITYLDITAGIGIAL